MEEPSNDQVVLVPHMIEEILSRSSLQTLARCRLLSKEVNSLTYHSYFKNIHSRRTQTISGFFVQSLRGFRFSTTFLSTEDNPIEVTVPSLNFLPGRVKIVASTEQGLLLCIDVFTTIPRYYVCKPCTKEWRKIPNPKTKYHTIGMAMMVLKSKPLHYKIVRFSRPEFCFFKGRISNEYCLRCEVFDSNTWSWKKSADVFLREGLRVELAVSVYGILHWLTTGNKVLGFDPCDETYFLFPLPVEATADYGLWERPQLVKYEGKLGFICVRGEGVNCYMEWWVLEKYLEEVWSKRGIIPMGDKEPLAKPRGFCSSEVAIFQTLNIMTFYNIKNKIKAAKKIEDCGCDGIFPFQSDYEEAGKHFQSRETENKSVEDQKNKQAEGGEEQAGGDTKSQLIRRILFCCFALLCICLVSYLIL